jgi:DNA-binding transcriptional regulator YiaG
MAGNQKMSHEDFRALRKSLELNIDEAAAVLGVGRDSLRIWEGEKKRHENRRAHPCAVLYLQCIAENQDLIPPQWPERLINGDSDDG